jgi:hypothetical protein
VEIRARPIADHGRAAESRSATAALGGKEGLAFVDIQEDEEYEVVIHNRSSRPVAVALSIDGLDVFHFSKERSAKGTPAFTHFLVEGNQSFSIVGWHHTADPRATDNALSFLVTAYGQGAVSKAGIPSRGRIGVIHAQFSHCLELPDGTLPRSGNETGFGPPREAKLRAVRVELEPPHDSVTVRYTR